MSIKTNKKKHVKIIEPQHTVLLFTPSYKMAFKTYEQIALLYLLPTLFYVLGLSYIGRIQDGTIYLSHHLIIGASLLLVWVIMSIANMPATLYLRVHALFNICLTLRSGCSTA